MTHRPNYVRDPYLADAKTVYAAGFQGATFVWCGKALRQDFEKSVTLHSAKTWPYIGTLPYSLEQLAEGVVHSDGLVFALDLKTAVDICLSAARKRKERADRVHSQVAALSKALEERNTPLVIGAIAEEHGL